MKNSHNQDHSSSEDFQGSDLGSEPESPIRYGEEKEEKEEKEISPLKKIEILKVRIERMSEVLQIIANNHIVIMRDAFDLIEIVNEVNKILALPPVELDEDSEPSPTPEASESSMLVHRGTPSPKQR